MAELGSASERRGGGGGRGNGERRRWACSVARERGPGERMRARESERGRGGVRGDARKVQGEAASRRWPSVAVRVLARRGHTPSCPLAGG